MLRRIPWRRKSDRVERFAAETVMSLNVLIGAILGSGVAIFLGGAPARALLARVKARIEERR